MKNKTLTRLHKLLAYRLVVIRFDNNTKSESDMIRYTKISTNIS